MVRQRRGAVPDVQATQEASPQTAALAAAPATNVSEEDVVGHQHQPHAKKRQGAKLKWPPKIRAGRSWDEAEAAKRAGFPGALGFLDFVYVLKVKGVAGTKKTFTGSMNDWHALPHATSDERAWRDNVWKTLSKTRENWHLGKQKARGSAEGVQASAQSLKRYARAEPRRCPRAPMSKCLVPTEAPILLLEPKQYRACLEQEDRVRRLFAFPKYDEGELLHHVEEVFASSLTGGQTEVATTDDYGMTILHKMAAMGTLQVVQFLVRQVQMDVDELDNDKCTALYLVACNGHADVAQELALHGADPCLTDKRGMTPLQVVAKNGYGEPIIQALVKARRPGVCTVQEQVTQARRPTRRAATKAGAPSHPQRSEIVGLR